MTVNPDAHKSLIDNNGTDREGKRCAVYVVGRFGRVRWPAWVAVIKLPSGIVT